jgi:hypothetical protein
MKTHHVALLAVALAFLAGTALAENTVVSGPQVDQAVPGPFHPLNINGSEAGKKNCLFCSNGENPVAMIFAREVTPELNALIKKIDAETVKNKDAKMGSFVVFLSNEDGLEKKLQELAKKDDLKECVLSIDDAPAGPKAYKIAKDADVTVVLYVNRTVKANYAFKKGELKDKDVEKVVADVSKIVK